MNLKLQNITHLFRNVRTRTIIIVTTLIVLFALIFGLGHLINKTAPPANSSVQLKGSPGNIKSIPGGIQESPSADYQRLQQQQNLQQAALAAKTGASAIPTLLATSQFNQSTQLGANSCARPCSCCNTCEESASACVNQTLNHSGIATPLSLQPSQLRAGTLVYDLHGKAIGRLGSDGKVRNKNGEIIGEVGPDGLVRAADGSVIGSAAVPAVGDPVYDATGHLIGHVGVDGKVLDAKGHVIGIVGPDGTVRNVKGGIIGRVGNINSPVGFIPGAPVYDDQGKLIGTVGADGRVRDAQGKIVATIDHDGIVRGLAHQVLGKIGATAPGTPVYDKQGRLIGTVGNDGIVRDSQGKAIATVGADGIVRDAQGNLLGSTTPPSVTQSSLGNVTSANSVSLLPNASDNPNPELQAILDRQAQQISAQKADQLQQQIQSSMSTQAAQLFVAWTSPAQQYVAGIPTLSGQIVGGGVAGSASSMASSGAPPAVKAGTIMYAVLLTAVNSDEPGPILAEIVQGKFKGARLIGTLSNQGKKVLLAFNTLTLPKLSQSIAINTVAIDESTARTALSSYTNNHYWLRYGTLFASAFIQGYGQSFLASNANYAGAIVINPSTKAPDLKPRDRIFVGLGQVGVQYASVLGSIFSTPPTVHVYSGTPMGILFLSDLAALPESS
jgi:YD repeat-containing protein